MFSVGLVKLTRSDLSALYLNSTWRRHGLEERDRRVRLEGCGKHPTSLWLVRQREMAHDANSSNGYHNGTNGEANGHAPRRRSLELKRGGFIASYPPFE